MFAFLAFAFAQVSDPGLPTEKRHMAILGTWSGANLIGGGIGLATAKTARGRSFHGTNLAWNTVNAGLVLAGGIGIHKRRNGVESEAVLRQKHRSLRTALGVNLGLDFAYVGTGLVLWGVGGKAGGADLRGVGQALTLQGGFLMAFDTVFLLSHHRRVGRDSMAIGPVGVSGRF